MCMHACIHTCIHTCTHIYIHTYIHIDIDVDINIDTDVQTRRHEYFSIEPSVSGLGPCLGRVFHVRIGVWIFRMVPVLPCMCTVYYAHAHLRTHTAHTHTLHTHTRTHNCVYMDWCSRWLRSPACAVGRSGLAFRWACGRGGGGGGEGVIDCP